MKCKSESAGFTLLELVSIILLLGIISAVAISRLNINTFHTASFEQELRSAIRFAQKFAIASGCEVRVDVNAGGYALTVRTDAGAGCLTASAGFGSQLNNPTGGTFTGAPPSGVAITSGLTFVYDRLGRPSASGTIVVDGQNIVIEAVTGYVH